VNDDDDDDDEITGCCHQISLLLLLLLLICLSVVSRVGTGPAGLPVAGPVEVSKPAGFHWLFTGFLSTFYHTEIDQFSLFSSIFMTSPKLKI